MASRQPEGLRALLSSLGVEDSKHTFAAADILTRPLDIYHSHLADLLLQLADCDPQAAYGAIQESNDLCLGDLEVVIPKLRIKGPKPKDLAVEWAGKFPETPLFDAPGDDGIHLRLFISPVNLARILLPYILDRGISYGCKPLSASSEGDVADGAPPRLVIDFSSPNLGKEFDGAHLRSTVIGTSIAALYEGMGWNVQRLNYLGDWGPHIGPLAVGWYSFGSEDELRADPLRHLLDVYTKILDLSKEQSTAAQVEDEHQALPISAAQDDFLRRLESGESVAVTLWKRLRDLCVSRYQHLYAQLGIKFDDYTGESEVSESTFTEIETVLREKGIYENHDGAWAIDFDRHGSKGLPQVISRRANGATSYFLRELGSVVERKRKYGFDMMVYVVAATQDTHFRRVFRTLELMGGEYEELVKTLHHLNFGKVQGLSPHAGQSGMLLSDIIDQCRKVIHETLQANTESDFLRSHQREAGTSSQIASELVRLALISQELSITKRTNTLNFALGTEEKMVATLDQYSGLKLQDCLDKLSPKLHLNSGSGQDLRLEGLDYEIFRVEDTPFADVLKLLAQFPNVTQHAFDRLDPSIILSYLLQIVDMLSVIWDEDETEDGTSNDVGEITIEASRSDAHTAGEGEKSIQAEEADKIQPPVISILYACVSTVLENGMNLIGLVPIKHGNGQTSATSSTQVVHTGEHSIPIAEPPEVTQAPKAIVTLSHERNHDSSDVPTVNEASVPIVGENTDTEGTSAVPVPQEAHDQAISLVISQDTAEDQTLKAELQKEPNGSADVKLDHQSIANDNTQGEQNQQAIASEQEDYKTPSTKVVRTLADEQSAAKAVPPNADRGHHAREDVSDLNQSHQSTATETESQETFSPGTEAEKVNGATLEDHQSNQQRESMVSFRDAESHERHEAEPLSF